MIQYIDVLVAGQHTCLKFIEYKSGDALNIENVESNKYDKVDKDNINIIRKKNR